MSDVKNFETTIYKIKVKKKGCQGKRLRFVYLTDLHNTEFGENNQQLLEQIEALHPDLVLCGGDMIIGRPGFSVVKGRKLMRRLAASYPVYAGTGNHEFRTRIYPDTYPHMYQAYHEPLRKAGVHFLENSSVSFRCKGVPLRICGYDSSRSEYRRISRQKLLPKGKLEKCFGPVRKEEFSILLAHNPQYIESYLAWGPDLVLSGHYHGGIMRLSQHVGAISPSLQPFTPIAHGLFRKGNSRMIVSAGLGEHTLPIRIHNPRELVVVDVLFG